ncbi:MAG: hypothetical protein EB075_05615 [Bacteroidetes bacterium]|jgi:hypothetical protein|nr:hypothetical protein [Bacteroidota bacterium]
MLQLLDATAREEDTMLLDDGWTNSIRDAVSSLSVDRICVSAPDPYFPHGLFPFEVPEWNDDRPISLRLREELELIFGPISAGSLQIEHQSTTDSFGTQWTYGYVIPPILAYWGQELRRTFDGADVEIWTQTVRNNRAIAHQITDDPSCLVLDVDSIGASLSIRQHGAWIFQTFGDKDVIPSLSAFIQQGLKHAGVALRDAGTLFLVTPLSDVDASDLKQHVPNLTITPCADDTLDMQEPNMEPYRRSLRV